MKIFLLFILLFLFQQSKSQSVKWCPNGAEWYYSYYWFSANGYVHFKYTTNDTINGIQCKKIERVKVTSQYGSSQVSYNIYTPIYTYEANGIVYMTDYLNNFDTLYNFNAVPGDRWQALKSPFIGVCDSLSYFEVMDTGHMLINNEYLKWLNIHFHGDMSSDSFIVNDTIIEKIGTSKIYMLPHDFCNEMVDGQEGGNFRCYSDSGISFKRFKVCDSIYIYTGINDLKETYISVFPNPVTNKLNIILPEGKINFLTVYDVLGKEIIKTRKLTDIDVSGLTNGVYLISVNDGNKVWKRVIIKE